MARSVTPKLNLGVWDDGDNPGAGSKTIKQGNVGLNGNWLILDDAVGTEHNPDGTHKPGVIKAENLNIDVVDGVTLDKNVITNKLQIKEGGVNTAQIADNAVTESKIANGAVTRFKIANGAVGYQQIDWGEIVIRAQNYVIFTFPDPSSDFAYLNNVQTSNTFGLVIPSLSGGLLYRWSLVFANGTKISSDILNIDVAMGDVITVKRVTPAIIALIKNGQTVYSLNAGPGQSFDAKGIVTISIITKYPD